MQTIHLHPQPYELRIEASILYECALHIAAYTRPDIHAHVEHAVDWHKISKRLPEALQQEVELAGRVHSWRSILFLAHRCDGLRSTPLPMHMDVFRTWMKDNLAQLRYLSAPVLSPEANQYLVNACLGSQDDQRRLLGMYAAHPLVGPNLQYLFEVTPDTLLRHIESLLLGWLQAAIEHPSELMDVLLKDADEKKAASATMAVPDLVREVLRGGEFMPDVNVRTICLIPQVAYRPFTILNTLPSTSVLYYPVSNASLVSQRDTQTMMDIAAVHKAIGDVHRVQILRILQRGPTSLSNLALTLDLAKSTVHHHMTLLRTSGLVTVNEGTYHVNERRVWTYSQSLQHYLGLEECEP